ncbi:putative transposase [Saccharolobus shibatae]|uniref:Putative transposase n=1 Tax=Saccharolobus shibatae TaxID=2286 RepID=A0A8F5BSA5_9CREN|nr:putative transposase [Saccharolobus shibatae]
MIGLISSTIYAEFGDVSRFSCSKARAYAGFAPRTKQSGESESHSGMIMGNKYLRRAFSWLLGGLSVSRSIMIGLSPGGRVLST